MKFTEYVAMYCHEGKVSAVSTWSSAGAVMDHVLLIWD